MIKIKLNKPMKKSPEKGDMRNKWVTAWLPTKVEDYLTGDVYLLWLGDYYVVQTFVEGEGLIDDYWQTGLTYLNKVNFNEHKRQLEELKNK